jgi:uncharacterized protein YnzC (UPF0291/DUF896 family)
LHAQQQNPPATPSQEQKATSERIQQHILSYQEQIKHWLEDFRARYVREDGVRERAREAYIRNGGAPDKAEQAADGAVGNGYHTVNISINAAYFRLYKNAMDALLYSSRNNTFQAGDLDKLESWMQEFKNLEERFTQLANDQIDAYALERFAMERERDLDPSYTQPKGWVYDAEALRQVLNKIKLAKERWDKDEEELKKIGAVPVLNIGSYSYRSPYPSVPPPSIVAPLKKAEEIEPLHVRYLLRDEGEDSPAAPTNPTKTGIQDIVVTDQTTAPKDEPFPGMAAFARATARNKRTLFIYGRDLPQDRSKPINITSLTPDVSYTLLALGSEMTRNAQGEPEDPRWAAGYEKAQRQMTPEQKAAFRKMDYLLVEVDFKESVQPGFYDLMLNRTPHSWYLEYGNRRAQINFVRETGNGTGNGLNEETEHTDLIFLPETVRIEVEVEDQFTPDKIQLQLLHNGLLLMANNEPRVLTATRVPGSPKKYLTEPINVVPEGDSRPPISAGGLEVTAKSNDSFSVKLADEGALITDPVLAHTFVPNPAEDLWSNAVKTADAAFPQDRYGSRIPLDDNRISDALQQELLSRRKAGANAPPPDFERDLIREELEETRNDKGIKQIVSVADLRLGHLAAMYLLRDTFIELMTDYQRELAKAEFNDLIALRGFRRLIEPYMKDKDFPLSRVLVTNANKDPVASRKITLADAFESVRPEFYAATFKKNQFLPRSQDNFDIVRAESYIINAVKEGLDNYKDAVNRAIERAKAIKDDRAFDQLMELTGANFQPVVARLNSRLMRFDQGKGRWVPDLKARKYVTEIETVADRFKAKAKVSEAESQVVLLALSLLPVFAPGSLPLRLFVNGVFAADVAVNTIPDYIRRDAELKFSLGASGVLGADRLNIAEAEKSSAWEVVKAVAGVSFGVVADLREVLGSVRAAERGRKLLPKIKGMSLAELKLQPKGEQADFLAAATQAIIDEKSGQRALTEDDQLALKKLSELGEEAKNAASTADADRTARKNLGALGEEERPVAPAAETGKVAETTGSARATSLPKTAVTVEEVQSAAKEIGELKAGAAKSALKDLEIREGILNELTKDPAKLAQISIDDLAFLRDPTRGLTDEQKAKVLKTVLEDWHDWHGLKEAFNGKPPKVNKVEMYKIIRYRTEEVDRLLKQVLDDVEKQVGAKLESKALGSVTLTSDYDISVSGEGAERVVAEFNKRFRSDPRFKGLESGTVFDTNVYTDPVYKLFSGGTANARLDFRYEAVQLDELKQFMYDQMATRKYLNDAEWAAHKARLLARAPSADMRRVLEYALGEAETAKRAARNLIAEKLPASIESVSKSNPNALLRATNDAYAEVLGDIDKLRVEARSLEKRGTFKPSFAQPGVPQPGNDALRMLGGRDYLVQLQKIDDLGQNLTPEALREIANIKSQLQELIASQIRSKQGIALYFASEAYQTEGAIAHVVGELQEQGRQINLEKLIENVEGKAIVKEGKLTPGQYLDSFYENRANMLKELEHARDAEGRFADSRYAAAKAAKYFIRQLDAMQQAGISLKGAITEDIVTLTSKIAKDKDKLDVVATLLAEKNTTAENFIKAVEDAADELAARGLAKSPVEERAAAIREYLDNFDPNVKRDVKTAGRGPKPSVDAPTINAGEGGSSPNFGTTPGTADTARGVNDAATVDGPSRPRGEEPAPPTKGGFADDGGNTKVVIRNPDDPLSNPYDKTISPNPSGLDAPTIDSETKLTARLASTPGSGRANDAEPVLERLRELGKDATKAERSEINGKIFTAPNGKTIEIEQELGIGNFSEVASIKGRPNEVVKFRLRDDSILNQTAAQSVEASAEASKALEKAKIPQFKITEVQTAGSFPYVIAEKANNVLEFAAGDKRFGDAVVDLWVKLLKNHIIAEDLHEGNLFWRSEGGELVCGIFDHDRIAVWNPGGEKPSVVTWVETPVYGGPILPYEHKLMRLNSLKGIRGYQFADDADFMVRMLEHKAWIRYDGTRWTSEKMNIDYLRREFKTKLGIDIDSYLPKKPSSRLFRHSSNEITLIIQFPAVGASRRKPRAPGRVAAFNRRLPSVSVSPVSLPHDLARAA